MINCRKIWLFETTLSDPFFIGEKDGITCAMTDQNTIDVLDITSVMYRMNSVVKGSVEYSPTYGGEAVNPVSFYGRNQYSFSLQFNLPIYDADNLSLIWGRSYAVIWEQNDGVKKCVFGQFKSQRTTIDNLDIQRITLDSGGTNAQIYDITTLNITTIVNDITCFSETPEPVDDLEITSNSVDDPNRDKITVVFNRIVTATNLGYSLTGTIRSIVSVSGSGTNTLVFQLSGGIEVGNDSINLVYNSGSGDTIDSEGQELPSGNYLVTNNLGGIAARYDNLFTYWTVGVYTTTISADRGDGLLDYITVIQSRTSDLSTKFLTASSLANQPILLSNHFGSGLDGAEFDNQLINTSTLTSPSTLNNFPVTRVLVFQMPSLSSANRRLTGSASAVSPIDAGIWTDNSLYAFAGSVGLRAQAGQTPIVALQTYVLSIVFRGDSTSSIRVNGVEEAVGNSGTSGSSTIASLTWGNTAGGTGANVVIAEEAVYSVDLEVQNIDGAVNDLTRLEQELITKYSI